MRPTINWLRKAMLMSIITHPLALKPEIYYPGLDEEITIQRGRLFGGAELIEPGLTLSVHPFHSSFDVLKGSYTAKRTTVEYQEAPDYTARRETLAQENDFERGYSSKVVLVAQLFYRDAGLNVPVNLTADVMESRCTQDRRYHGHNVRFLEDPTIQQAFQESPEMPTRFSIEVQILPGEEILTQWLDLLKDIIRDVKVLYPFTQYRNPYIVNSDYPTTTWLARSGNLVFHTAYHLIQFDVSEPPRTWQTCIPPIQSLNIVNHTYPG